MALGDDSIEIAVLGDSISNGYYDESGRGWVVRLCEKLNADHPNTCFIRNHAVSGDGIADVKYRLFGAVERDPQFLFIAVGVNDIQMYPDRDGDILPLAFRRVLWFDVLKKAKKLVPQVIVFGLLPVDESRIPARYNEWGEGQFYRNDYIIAYNQHISAWCAESDVPFFNFFDRFMAAGHVDLLADDVHPNGHGHALLAEWAYEAFLSLGAKNKTSL